MTITKIQVNHFTVFEDLSLEFTSGINIFIGPNGAGKTHLMKVLYAACQAADPKVSFSNKIVTCFLPDDYRISRLLSRKQGSNTASVKVSAQKLDETINKTITAKFNSKTKKWDAEVTGEEGWEKQLGKCSSVYIPAKEILSNAYNLNAAVEKNNVSFDDTYLDVINSAKIDISVGKNAAWKETILKKIESIISGKVFYDNDRDEFYLKQGNSKLEFNLVAEGIRKIALLWQLIKNGSLEPGALLFWDEPEANINPMYIPLLVDIMLELQSNGVQIFISTHDYFLVKYFDTRKNDNNEVLYHSFYRPDDKKDAGVVCETADSFTALKNNPIMDTFLKLYHEEVGKAMSL
ncbi:MAG: ATP-binding protein [Peptococcaceae bacterium]|nr:ATP-binding protein [Peptococcaceae bacterium]